MKITNLTADERKVLIDALDAYTDVLGDEIAETDDQDSNMENLKKFHQIGLKLYTQLQ